MLLLWVIRAGFACAWGALIIVWIVGLFYSKRTVRRSSYSSRFVLAAPLVACYLLVASHAIPGAWFDLRPWPHTLAIQAAGLAITIFGCFFAIWARVTLGSNWSGLPKVKHGHELIVRGPLYVALRGVKMISRFGGKAVRPLGQLWLSLSCRSATAPLFARRGESKAL